MVDPIGPGMLRLLGSIHQLPVELSLPLSGSVMLASTFSNAHGGLYNPTFEELERAADNWVLLNCDLDMIDHVLIVRSSSLVVIGYVDESDSLLIFGDEGKAEEDEIAQYLIASGSLIIFEDTLARFASRAQ